MYTGPGTYQNFKGQFYYVIGIAKHSETMEDHVLYCPLYVPQSGCPLTIRPLENFNQNKVYLDKIVPRYTKVTEDHPGRSE